jgi:hypothetical protein
MSNILVAYASKHGATAEMVDAVADQLRTDPTGRDRGCSRESLLGTTDRVPEQWPMPGVDRPPSFTR